MNRLTSVREMSQSNTLPVHSPLRTPSSADDQCAGSDCECAPYEQVHQASRWVGESNNANRFDGLLRIPHGSGVPSVSHHGLCYIRKSRCL